MSALVENHPDLGMNIYVYFFSSNKGRDWPLAKLEEVAVVQSMFSCFAGDGWPFTRGTKAFEVQYKEGNPIINASRDYENWLSSM